MILASVPAVGDMGVMGFSFGVNLLIFILQAVALYAIAKRRGIHHSWLAWVPFGNAWILGCISDQYRYVTRHSIRNKRRTLLTLKVLTVAAAVLVIILSLNFASDFAEMIAQERMTQVAWMTYRSNLAVIALVSLAMCVLTVVSAVIQCMALYDLFRSCEPDNAVVYLLISIFTGIGQMILLMACRNRDKGMPPRKPPVVEQVYDEPAWNNE